MKKAVVVEASDVKKILAEHFGVPEENVIKSQYTFTVVEPGADQTKEETAKAEG